MPMKAHEEQYEEDRRRNLRFSAGKEDVAEGHVRKWLKIEREGDEPVPCLLVHKPPAPSGKLMLFLHGLDGRKEDALDIMTMADPLDFSALAIDARMHGERKGDMSKVGPTDILAGFSKTIVDNRLALDVAFQQGWALPGKVVLAGVSMGGILGGVVAGVDQRIMGAALLVPGGDLAGILAESKHPMVAQFRGRIPGFVLRAIGGQLANVDPINYVDKIAPRPLLIQLGKHDIFVPFENGMKLFEKAKEPKDLVVHDSGHELPMDRAAAETVQWITKRLPNLA